MKRKKNNKATYLCCWVMFVEELFI